MVNSINCKLKLFDIKVNESRCIVLFVVSRSIGKVFLYWLCQYLLSQSIHNHFFSIFFSICLRRCVTPHCLYRDSLALKTLKEFQLKCEVCDLFSYTKMLIDTDMLAFGFWLKYISSQKLSKTCTS